MVKNSQETLIESALKKWGKITYGKSINMVTMRKVSEVKATYNSFDDFLDYSLSCPNIQ